MAKKIAGPVRGGTAAATHAWGPAAPCETCAHAGRSGNGADIGPS